VTEPPDIWATLAIAPTRDEAEIRRAYAVLLKRTNPEDDAAGFQQLRAAYEAALRSARFDASAALYPEQFDEPQEAFADAPRDSAPAAAAAAPQPSDPPAAPAPPATPSADAAHAALCDALAEAVVRHAPEAELRDCLRAVLGSPAIERIDIAHRTELFLVDLAHRGRPATDCLIDPIIAHYEWEERPVGWDGEGGLGPAMLALRQRVLAERADAAFLARCSDRRHEFAPVLRAFARPIRERNIWGRLGALPNLRLVGRFIMFAQERHPSVLATLDAETLVWMRDKIGTVLAWWERGWRIGLALLVIGAIVVAGLLADPADDPAPAKDLTVAQLRDLVVKRPKSVVAAISLCRESVRTEPGFIEISATHDDCADAEKRAPGSLRVQLYRGLRDLKSAALAARAFADQVGRHQPGEAIALDIVRDTATKAEAKFDSVLAVSPNDPYARIGKGLARRYAGDEEAALRWIGEGVAAEGGATAFFSAFGIDLGAHQLTPSVDAVPGLLGATPRFDAPARVTKPATQDAMWAAQQAFGVVDLPDGSAMLVCRVSLAGLAQRCLVQSETPRDAGLADVALRLSEQLVFAPATKDGVPVDGAVVRLPFHFVAAQSAPERPQ